MRAKRQRGFTLTELVIAITVAGIMIGLATPSFIDMIQKKRLKLAAETVIADFSFFRQEGLKRRVPDFAFNVDDGATWCYGIAVGTCTCTTANSCDVREVSSDDFNGIASLTSSSAKFSYDWVRGTVTAGTITLATPRGFDLRVVINGLGRTSICSPSNNVHEYQSC